MTDMIYEWDFEHLSKWNAHARAAGLAWHAILLWFLHCVRAYEEEWDVDTRCLVSQGDLFSQDCAKHNNINIQQLHILLTSPQQWHHQNVKGHTMKMQLTKEIHTETMKIITECEKKWIVDEI